MNEKVQINVRIDSKLRKDHKLVTDFADENLESMTEAAIRFFYGSKDLSVLSLQKKAMAAKEKLEKGTKLNFDMGRSSDARMCAAA